MVSSGNIKFKLIGMFDGRTAKDAATPIRVIEKDGKAILLLGKKTGSDVADTAVSDDGFNFHYTHNTIPRPQDRPDFPNAVLVPNLQPEGEHVMFFGDRSIQIAYASGSGAWKSAPNPLLTASGPVELSNVFIRDDGLLLLYYEKTIENKRTYYFAGLAFFDSQHPDTLVWKTQEPVWRSRDLWPDENVRPLGAIFLNGQLITYWHVADAIVYAVVLAGFTYDPRSVLREKITLAKHPDNPIIAPRPDHDWEAFNTFNPAALYAGGKVHILYRAQGFDYISSVGYAAASDGMTIDERLDEPVYTPAMDFEQNTTGFTNDAFISGGGFGGCEDPRITLLGDRVYMTYVAFAGWDPPRLALTSILLDNFLHKRWLWSKPVLISPPGVVDKSGCLMPEKIRGKYVFFHRVFPNILIDYVDDLAFDGETKWLKGQYKIKVRPDKWDSRKIGAGAPPIKTRDGWLLIYYGVDDRDAGSYHIGAMILDIDKPEKVLYRCDTPILSPTKEYEYSGFKPFIVYPCGAIKIKDELFVYYGGADSVVCVAMANLSTFLEELKTQKSVHLAPIHVKEVVL